MGFGFAFGVPAACLAMWIGYRLTRSWCQMNGIQRVTAMAVMFALLLHANRIIFEDLSMYWYGGYATVGKAENGRYFVGNRGVYREVSAPSYRNSLEYERWSDGISNASWLVLLLILLYWALVRRAARLRGAEILDAARATPGGSKLAAAYRNKAVLFMILSVASFICSVFAVWLGLVCLMGHHRATMLFVVAALFVSGGIASHVMTRRMWVRYGIARTDYSHCRHCGYSLTGNTSGACPECGAVIVRGE
jgi:hypothetical protein